MKHNLQRSAWNDEANRTRHPHEERKESRGPHKGTSGGESGKVGKETYKTENPKGEKVNLSLAKTDQSTTRDKADSPGTENTLQNMKAGHIKSPDRPWSSGHRVKIDRGTGTHRTGTHRNSP